MSALSFEESYEEEGSQDEFEGSQDDEEESRRTEGSGSVSPARSVLSDGEELAEEKAPGGCWSWLRNREWKRATDRNARASVELETTIAALQRTFIDFEGRFQDQIRANKATNNELRSIATGAQSDVVLLKEELDMVRLDFRALKQSTAYMDHIALAAAQTERDAAAAAEKRAVERVKRLEQQVARQQSKTARLLSDLEKVDHSRGKRVQTLRRAWRSVVQDEIVARVATSTASSPQKLWKRSARVAPDVLPEVAASSSSGEVVSTAAAPEVRRLKSADEVVSDAEAKAVAKASKLAEAVAAADENATAKEAEAGTSEAAAKDGGDGGKSPLAPAAAVSSSSSSAEASVVANPAPETAADASSGDEAAAGAIPSSSDAKAPAEVEVAAAATAAAAVGAEQRPRTAPLEVIKGGRVPPQDVEL